MLLPNVFDLNQIITNYPPPHIVNDSHGNTQENLENQMW